jgi:hypothetical protein
VIKNSIKFANINDTDDIIKFISNYWKKNHILGKNKELFLYYYQDKNRVNFVISRDELGKINGILGFIKSASVNSDIWAAMWKTIENNSTPMLGVELLEYLRSSNEYNILLSSGITDKTIGIYKYLGIYTDYLRQFVLINDRMKNYKIAKISDKKYLNKIQFTKSNGYVLKVLTRDEIVFNFEKHKGQIPYKDKGYFIKRYFKHPVYKYKIYGIIKNNKTLSLVVVRLISENGSKILRVIDFFGHEKYLQFITHDLYKILVKSKLEYIDFMCFGFDYELLLKAGFYKVDLNNPNLIIPNYFFPFAMKNTKINFYVDSCSIDSVRICKGDGDQDRPQ